MKKNILIVDDDKLFIKSFIFYLTNHFNDKINIIYEAYDGLECLKIIRNNNIHIVFMDYKMPKLNGIETTEIIKKENRFIKIVGISFNNDENIIFNMIHSGAIYYIQKDNINESIISNILDKTCLTL